MEITNRNTFTDETVHIDNEKGVAYIGKACYKLSDLEAVIAKSKIKDINESLNYRVLKYKKKLI